MNFQIKYIPKRDVIPQKGVDTPKVADTPKGTDTPIGNVPNWNGNNKKVGAK